MMKKLFNKKGETYIDVAITVMIVAFVDESSCMAVYDLADI